jgi:integrase
MPIKSNQEIQFAPLFKKFITDSKSGRRVTASGKRITKGTIYQYQIAYHLIVAFEKDLGRSVRIKILNTGSKKVLHIEKNYWKHFFRLFSGWLYQRGYFDKYVGAIAKILRTVFNYLIKEQCLTIGSFHSHFKVPTQQTLPIVLEPTQLKFLITDTGFQSRLNKKLERCNDIFIFGCTVGLRFSDLMKLKKTDLQYTSDIVYVMLYTSKTGKQVKIPLPDYAIAIISKYKTRAGRYVLPRLANTNFNLHVKELIELAGWTYQQPKIRFQQGKPQILKNKKGDGYRFCDHITSHTMRRTAITTLLLMGVEENIVRSISGHAPGSKEFYKYVALVQTHMNKQVLKAFEKLIADE